MTAKKTKKKPKVAIVISIGGKKPMPSMPVKKGRFQMGDKYRHDPRGVGGTRAHNDLVSQGASRLGGQRMPPPSVEETDGGDEFIDAIEAEERKGRGVDDREQIAGEQVDMEYLRRTQPHLFDREPSKFVSGGAGQRMRRGPGARSMGGKAGLRQALADPEQGPASFYPKGTNLALSEDGPMTFAWSILKAGRPSPDWRPEARNSKGCDKCGRYGVPLTDYRIPFVGTQRLCGICYGKIHQSLPPAPSYGGDSEGSYMVNPGDSHM
jgi:hypothetical protein